MPNSIIDLIIRIKNGYLAKKDSIESPYSIFREQVLSKINALGFIKDYEIKGEKIKKIIVNLIYKEGVAGLTDIKILSKPGRRWYVGAKDIKPVMSNFGYSILSTSKGILSNIEAKKQKIGGELLFEIW